MNAERRTVAMRFVMFTVLNLWSTNAYVAVTTGAVQDAIAASRARIDAFNRRDLEAMKALTADEYIFTNDGGELGDRAKALNYAAHMPASKDRYSEPRDYSGRSAGDVVVLRFLCDGHERWGAADFITSLSMLETWVKRAGRWQLLAKSLTPVPVDHRPRFKVDPAKLAEYAGSYEWPDGTIERISVQGEQLVSRYANDPPEAVWFIAPDIQATASDLSEGRIRRDASGAVSGYEYIRADGQFLEVRKVK